ncbi:MAG: ATP-binding protein [Dehalococcoidia bacterium]
MASVVRPHKSDESITVLLVEDNPGDARLIREVLAEGATASYNVEHADRLSTALQLLDQLEVDVLLLDLGLPDSQGLATLGEIQDRAPQVPVVVLTGLNDEVVGAEAVRSGAQDYLPKSEAQDRLLWRVIRYAVERKRIQEELRQHREHLEELVEQRTSELKESQEQLLQSEKMAAVGQMVSGVAHELNNPLMAISATVELMQQYVEDETVRNDLEALHSDTERAIAIVRNLLSFARKRKPQREQISVNEAIRSVVNLRSYEASLEDIEIIQNLDDSNPSVTADFQQLQQVFLNILTNAEQAMKEAHGKGCITISTRTVKGKVQAIFVDDGPGIPDDVKTRIFEPFFTTKDVGKGTGLGLSICYGIVQEHGGTIYVESKDGEGTTFTVELPILTEVALCA